MWRSVAARSRDFCRAINAIRNHKVYGAVLPFRSRFPVLPLLRPQTAFFSSLNDPSRGLGENGETQMADTASVIDSHEEQKQSNLGFTETEDLRNGNSLSDEGESLMQSSIHIDDGNDMSQCSVEEEYEIDRIKLDALLTLLDSDVDSSLESTLDELDLELHQDLMIIVLETPGLLAENLIKFFKWAVHKPGYKVTTRVVEALVLAVCSGEVRRLDVYALWDLIREIGNKEKGSLLNADVLNVVINSFSKLGKGKAAFEVFNEFEVFGCAPNAETFYFTIEALCRRSFVDWACTVCRQMLDAGVLPESERVGNTISWLCEEGRAEEALSVFDLAKQCQDKYPSQRSLNTLVDCLSKKDDTVRLAVTLLAGYSPEARKHAIKWFSSVIRGLCRMKSAKEAKALLLDMISNGPLPTNAAFNSIITAFSKAGDMEEAKEVMKLMERQGLKPDVYAYTVVISGYTKGGQMEEACEVLSEAKSKHSRLSPATYHSLIRGYCKLEEFDKAMEVFDAMKTSGVHPNADEYSKLIQSLCLKTLEWERAEKLLEEMRQKGLQLNGITRGLIQAVKELDLDSVGNEKLAAEV